MLRIEFDMKRIQILFIALLISSSSFSQSTEMLDSVNYYFYELLTHERDSINTYHDGDENFIPLVHVSIETDESKFVNPIKHLDKAFYELGNEKKYTPHSTTNIENFLKSVSSWDFTGQYTDPKAIAKEFFMCWKNSPKGHYDVMVNANEWENYFYNSFIILYKIEFDPNNLRNSFVLAASYTVFKND
jgi:hypothetical protein